MATFAYLPSELIGEIVFYTFLMDQVNRSTDLDLNRAYRAIDSPSLDENNIGPLLTSHALSKITTRSFTQNLRTNIEKCAQSSDQLANCLLIFAYNRCRKSTLLALSLTCKEMRAYALPLIFQLLEFDSHTERGCRISALVALFSKNPTLSKQVRALSLICGGSQPLPGPPPPPQRGHMFRSYYAEMEHIELEIATKIIRALGQTPSARELQIEDRMSRWFTDLILSVFLDQLSNLESLQMAGGDIYCMKYLFRHTTYFENRKIPMGLKSLQEFSFVCFGCGWRMKEVNGYEVLPIFTLPSIRKIHLSLLGRGRTKGYETSFRSYYGKSTVRELEFHSSSIGKCQLNVFLQFPAALESFKFIGFKEVVLPSDRYVDSITASEMGNLLSLQASSLKTVDIEQFDKDPIGVPFPRNLWKEFPCLQHLGIPWGTSLLAQVDGELTKAAKLKDSLPVTLLTLKLYVHHCCDLLNWSEELQSLFEWKSSCCTKLEKVFLVVDRESCQPEEPSSLCTQSHSSRASWDTLWAKGTKQQAAHFGIEMQIRFLRPNPD